MQPTMSTITLVEHQRSKTRPYRIYLDGQFAFAVHEDTMIRHRLFKGEQIDAEIIARIIRDEERQSALNGALAYLGRRAYSVQEMRKKLQTKGYAADIIDEVMDRLLEQRYMDDESFAVTWTEQRVYSQKKGRRWVRQELQHKGVTQEVIQHALNRIDPEQELMAAAQLAKKRWNQLSKLGSDPDRKRKTATYLLRRGYSSNIVQQALKQAVLKHDPEDDSDADDTYN